MYPVVATVELFGRVHIIGSYGVLLAVALVTFGGLLVALARRRGLDPGLVVAVVAIGVPFAGLGAHALSAAVAWARGVDPLQAALRPTLTFYGGAAGLVLALVFGARATGMPAAQLVDAAIVPGALAHAIGRVGCLLGGCCYGAVHHGPLSVTYRHPLAPAEAGLPRHPVQLYEAVVLIALAVLFQRWSQRQRTSAGPWLRFRCYVGAYALARVGLESLRGDADRGLWWAGGISTSQLISLSLVALVVGIRTRQGITPTGD
ncbi:MAG: prolipoprotein diacylglyceryl transferase [Myxococcales bacterium]|nr:prolipoprotein diacylglyceryl transferase [Myxococcales bacterium]MDD9969758.1 prolipoprotein diacylglyceryl transferase [Myxococcales bacterium]